ncbi:MAG: TIGR03960 family B12-binding radical SAM protein [Deltaproteobacteria bacterium]|nr:TIGR03960 family B12-binding radical SAM protein [Deltaproteobacteria bacterium]
MMTELIDQTWFSTIRRPSRYLGGEVNAVRKDLSETEVSMALCFPDVYDVGMSHLGLKILYQILNSRPWIAAERVFTPWSDLEQSMRSSGFPLESLESKRVLSDFDIVGFSLQHELCYTNVLTMLDLGRIPFFSRERKSGDPLVIAGGPACFNPEPVADFFDAFVIGDGEEAALSLCRAVREAKRAGHTDREDLLMDLRHIPGIYIPSLFRVHYQPRGPVKAIEPLLQDYQEVGKAIVPDIEGFPPPLAPVVPYTGLVHDRLSIEISRGCTRGCRFCQAGMIYRPVRERHPETILSSAEEALRNTGYEDLSLLSLSCWDYQCLLPLLQALMDRFGDQRVSISLPSLRIDSLDPAWMEQIKRVRKTGFTLAPEAGNDRLRKMINKGLTHDDILHTAQQVFAAGWNLIKLYFMIGLPGERKSDVEDMASLIREVASLAGKTGRRAKVNASVATFVPKSHTPFMWAPQLSPEQGWERLNDLRHALKNSRVRLKWNSPGLSWLEGIFSRGDRRLAPALVKAWERGARFDAWDEHFNKATWEKAFLETGIDPGFYLFRERPLDEVFPWNHINSGVTRGFLKKEWKKAVRETETPDCRQGCLECGVCDHETTDLFLISEWVPGTNPPPPPPANGSEGRKYRLTFKKGTDARFLAHLELVRVFLRAFRRAGIQLVYSKGYHPMPKISFVTALPVGMESHVETMDIETINAVDPSDLMKEVNKQLPQGISISKAEVLEKNRKKARLKQSQYVITLQEKLLKESAVAQFLHSDTWQVTKVTSKGEKEMNARRLVESIEILSSDSLQMRIHHNSGPGLNTKEIVAAIFSLNPSETAGLRIVKTGQVLE